MDPNRFDTLTRGLLTGETRRRVLARLGAALGLGVLLPFDAEGKKGKKKAKLNAFDCVNVGSFCKNAGQCCSGICKGKKGKKKCKAHDATTCQPDQSILECDGTADVPCVTTTGDAGRCMATTGQAGYCFADGDCFACKKDADCIPFCGPQAACIVCASCEDEGGTGCVGPSDNSCGALAP